MRMEHAIILDGPVFETRLLGQLKRFLVGKPIPSHLAHHERLGKATGLAVLSSDALSSVAYATEEILRVLMVGGIAAMSLARPISLLIAMLLAIVAFSYRQTIYVYSHGGGDYMVAKENLSVTAGLTAAAALLIDYTLTVAVSVSAGVAAITSALPWLHINRVELGLAFVTVLMVANLRGLRESARLFSVPTYGFITIMLLLVASGVWQLVAGRPPAPVDVQPLPSFDTGTLTTFALLTAFANGCTAMTGVEAILDGTPAFRPPEPRNAAATLIIMAAIATTMFVGITYLASTIGAIPSASETIVSQIGRSVFGSGTVLYFVLQTATTLILVLAANTAYADFPRLASVVARDRFMPRQFMNQGDKLAFSNGIIALSVAAGVLIFIFKGDTHRLIPLYMIGVFLSFTLSQSGMFLRWRRLKPPRWRVTAAINGFGAIVTGIVLVIVGVTKGPDGAWIVMILIPAIVILFRITKSHYDDVAAQLTLRDWAPPGRRTNVVIVPISGMQRAVVHALRYAESISTDVRAVYVNDSPAAVTALRKDWKTWGGSVRLVVLDSPFRSVMEPLLEYIRQVGRERTNAYITVVLPEFVPSRWWHHLLHNQRALLIKGMLLFRPNIIVTSVPFHLR
jgi:amino acid transporter